MSVLRTAVCITAVLAGLCVPAAAAHASVCEESIPVGDGAAELLGEVGTPILAGAGPLWFVVGVQVVGFYRSSSGDLYAVECLDYDIRGD